MKTKTENQNSNEEFEKLSCSENPNSSDDLVRRADAIKELRLAYPMIPFFKELREEWAIKTEGYREAEKIISNLPSAQPKRGEWIIYPPDRIGCTNCRCSNCRTEFFFPRIAVEPYDFCPHCGAKMEVEHDSV